MKKMRFLIICALLISSTAAMAEVKAEKEETKRQIDEQTKFFLWVQACKFAHISNKIDRAESTLLYINRKIPDPVEIRKLLEHYRDDVCPD